MKFSILLNILLAIAVIYLVLTPPDSIESIKTLEVRDTIIQQKYITGKTRILRQTDTILKRWDSIAFFFDSAECNLKLKDCADDVKREAQNVKQAYSDCDSALISKNNIIQGQKMMLINRKTSKLGIYSGIGLGLNTSGQVAPNINISLGFKIKEHENIRKRIN